MISIALFGVSGYGRCLLDAIRLIERSGTCRLEAVCIVNRNEEEVVWNELSAGGVRCFEDAGSMWSEMKGRINLTILPTPPHTHCDYTLQAFSCGSHVLVEKPISTNMADARRMAMASELSGYQLFVGFQDMCVPSTTSLKQSLVGGRHRKINSISFLGLWPREQGYYSRNSWAGKCCLDGKPINDNPVSNAFSHFLNLALFFAGSDQTTSARILRIEAELFRANEIETFDTAALRLHTDRGIPIHFYCSHSTEESYSPTIRIKTETEVLEWRYEDGLYSLGTAGDESHSHLIFNLPKREESRITMIENCISAILGSDASVCPAETGMIPLAITEQLSKLPVQRVHQSLITGQETKGGFLLAVRGLSRKLHLCHEMGMLPAELPPPILTEESAQNSESLMPNASIHMNSSI